MSGFVCGFLVGAAVGMLLGASIGIFVSALAMVSHDKEDE